MALDLQMPSAQRKHTLRPLGMAWDLAKRLIKVVLILLKYLTAGGAVIAHWFSSSAAFPLLAPRFFADLLVSRAGCSTNQPSVR